ncbi:MAG TPA: tetratricopeptide repeat protein [Pyrinomonadaceae bacterium]|jgi:tetratricopeptide (TPR) repeat protein
MKYTRSSNRYDRFGFLFFLTVFTFSVLIFPASVAAQTENLSEMRSKVADLLQKDNINEALPLLEKIAQADPEDAETQFYLGFALLAKAMNSKDKVERKALRLRARGSFIKAKAMGKTDNIVDAFISSIPFDGSESKGFSENEQANSLMEAGEQAFTSGKIDEALAAYQKAFQLDPKIYEAALFSGDMYVKKNDFSNAEIWYQKAIAIAPNRETAYRYSATPLMRQGKTAQARDRYIEAYISEPYSRFALNGMLQWGETTNTRMAHPRVEVPESKTGADGKTATTINVNPLADDGSMAWIGYTATRAEWRERKFAKTFPAEKTYRHTLQEEAEALRSVIKIANETKAKTKTLNPQIETLMKLDRDGLLEAFIIMAMPDEGIALDQPAYLRQNRDKLRQYVVKYVIGGK